MISEKTLGLASMLLSNLGSKHIINYSDWYVVFFYITSFTVLIFICPCIANIIPIYNQQDATFLDLFVSTDALHVSGGSSTHHQEHTIVHTASGIVNQCCCLLLSWMRWNSTWRCMYSYVLLMMGGGNAWNM